MADPLQLLREFTVNKRPVVLDGDCLVFDGVRLARDTQTSFRSLKGQGPHYTLDACWFFLQHAETRFAEYLVECSKHRFPKVSLVDKKELLAYLTGKIDSSSFISLISPALMGPPSVSVSSLASSSLDDSALMDDGKRSAFEAQLGSQPDSALGSIPKKARLEPQDIELDDRLKESKLLVARRLEQLKGVKATAVSTTGSLSDTIPEGLSKEQMEALRLKRRKKKLTSIQSEDIPERIAGTKDKPSFVEADAIVTADIINREKQLRTRISVLHSDSKRFTDIISFIQTYQEKEKRRKKEQQQKQAEERSSGYNRYDINEKQVWRTKLQGTAAEEWDIDTRGTFAGLAGFQSISSAITSSSTPVSSSGSAPSTLATRQTPVLSKGRKSHQKRLKPSDLVPIIIVPSALTSLITLYNVQDFLENGVFVPPIERKNQGVRKENLVVVKRKKGKEDNKVVPYHIMDNPSKFGLKEWDRVVAVFAMGPTWQFKDWKWASTSNPSPVEIFSKGMTEEAKLRGVQLTHRGLSTFFYRSSRLLSTI